MTDKEIQSFINNYSENDFDRIRFDWNGKHGDEFEDINEIFRIQVCETIKNDFSCASDKLILDLYLELSKHAGESWGIYESYHLFANELLERGGIAFFDAYIEGASQCMDTEISSGILNLSRERLDEILKHITSRIAESLDKSEIQGYDYMQKRFELLSKQVKD